jgi:SNF family Na+-dependent transporter
LIPFFIFLFIIGIPVFTLETLLGQILRKGPIEIYSQIHKKYFGVGLSQVILQFILSVYYAIILCWSLYFFFQSFISPLPWMPYSEADNDIEKILNLYYFKNEILKQSEGIHEMGSINWDLFICLIITYLFIFICIYNGVETSSKAVYVTATAPFILSFILLFKYITLI